MEGAHMSSRAKSPLGHPKEWPSTLRAFAVFITTLPHPSAVLWGDQLILIHNAAWKEAADGTAKQGAPQKDLLAEQALSIIRTAMMGKARQSLQADLFLNNQAQDGVHYQALLSPLMEDLHIASGVVIQLFQMSHEQEQKKSQQDGVLRKVQEALAGGKSGTKLNVIGGNDPLDNLPLDENPFFQRFAAMLPTGMAILNYQAEAVFVNEQFFELTTSDGQNFRSWPQSIHPEDYDRVMDAYQECFKGPGRTLRVEFRTMDPGDIWRLLLLSPLGDTRMQDESIEKYGGFICAVIDITPNKTQELAQKRAAQEAVERKEQQERFIDMISHEIRNPLSAVLHCAEEILETVEPQKDGKSESSELQTSAVIESAETIKLCVAHQKNIVDDILSFSKLDSSMLSLCPRSVQPRRQLADSLRMFQPEIKKQRMELNYIIDKSYEEAGVDWVKADLVRISQVLLNLVTNAIKFTARKEGQKKIIVMVGASFERPTSYGFLSITAITMADIN
jgi:PAS domain-containing protein